MDYHSLAKQILVYIGGADNIKKVGHCATRLRFNVIDKNKVQKDKIKQLDGVIQVVFAREQYQVVIGPQVAELYDEFIKLGGIPSENTETDEQRAEPKEKGILGLLNRFISFISSLFMPFLEAICGAGVLKGLLALLTTVGWLSAKGGTYIILNAASDSLFYFLPMFIAITAAKQLKTDRFVSLAIAGALVYPSIVVLATNNTTLKFMGIPVLPMSYTSSVIPIILSIWILSYLEPLLKKAIPDSLKYVFVALLELVIMVPLTLMVVGPIGSTISHALAESIMAVYNHAAILAGLLIGGLWQVIVMFGFHWMILPLIMSNIANNGVDPVFPIACTAIFSQAGAALGVFLKTKNKKMKQVSGSAFIAAIFGITEPTLYGVTLKYKKPFYIAIGSSAIGGIIVALAGTQAHAFAFPSLLSIPTYLGTGFIGEIIGLLVSFIGAAVLTYLFGLNGVDESVKNKNDEPTVNPIEAGTESDLIMPVSGQKIPLKNVNDEVFSSEKMGKGIAIIPDSSIVVAPVAGKITATFDTNHAIGITDGYGTQILIHLGIDTVSLKGKYFKSFVHDGQEVAKGQKLIEFDYKEIAKTGLDNTVMMIILNSADYKVVPEMNPDENTALTLTTI
ncbi:TPA: PTS transporter subunit EIIC [Enterococcus faecium]|nr:PTS transporter subunit EIIC [Enterococcus faecium]